MESGNSYVIMSRNRKLQKLRFIFSTSQNPEYYLLYCNSYYYPDCRTKMSLIGEPVLLEHPLLSLEDSIQPYFNIHSLFLAVLRILSI